MAPRSTWIKQLSRAVRQAMPPPARITRIATLAEGYRMHKHRPLRAESSAATAARRRTADRRGKKLRAVVAAYSRKHPYSRQHSTRVMAIHLAPKLRCTPRAVRARLSRLHLR